ncbi:MAG: hypothetical protein ACPGJF_08605 [Sinimarinibacterium flocculans]|uniref:linalool dehydratase/isomerase domain-containing protein n=1 Tax=Sinimarinibacterium flocculans TaxID=985250 RepID=UPI003C485B0A
MDPASPTVTVATIPLRDRAAGPLTRQRYRRLAAVYAGAAVLGWMLWTAAPSAWRAFGLGLLMPGAGFAAGFTSLSGVAASVAAWLLTIVLFALGFFAWFGSGNVVAPVAVWLLSALAAAIAVPVVPWTGAPWLVMAILGLAGGLAVRTARRTTAQALRQRARRNVALRERALQLRPAGRFEPAPLNRDALPLLRHVLDRALQPVDRYDGINWVDQFQFGALRYALCGMGYALSGVHYGATPAFTGYLSEAQRRLHLKMLDHRNWKYWVWENAWGNLALDPNPIHHRDNVMYHGWYMAMLAEYISNTGDTRYQDEPLVLRHPSGREWRYRFSEICEVLHRSHRKSAFTLFPCEPNWIYPMCNNFSAIALKVHDRLYGTRWFAEIESDYRRRFDDEFCTLDGRVLAIRSTHTGLTLPMLTSAMADSVTAHFQHGTFPDIARRSWEIARMDYIRVLDGRIEIEARGWDRLDTGSYRPSMITTYTQIGAAAAEMGDLEVAALVRERVREEFDWRPENDGAVSLDGVSTQAHATTLYHWTARPNQRRSMHADGIPDAERAGPVLAEAPYPDVLVCYARNDGSALALELAPGCSAAVGRTATLGLDQLRPGQRYRIGDARVCVADAGGRARFDVRIEAAPQRLLVAPAP